MSVSLSQQDGLYSDALIGRFWRSFVRDEVNFTKVVEHARDGEHVQGAKCSFLEVSQERVRVPPD
jgi:hypothetical protein